MNFVIFSYSFLPKYSAEAFCTSRFANALVEAGHNVRVVTIEHKQQVEDTVIHELNPHIKDVVYVPVEKPRKTLFARIKYQTPIWDSLNYNNCVRVLKKVLLGEKDPILVSRMLPDASGIIAWHCRKLAKLWIHHFSDPYPWYLKGGLLGRIMNHFTYRWCRRFLNDSDFCTITCPDIVRFFQERVCPVEKSHFVLVPHIGEPMITPQADWISPCKAERIMVHAGNCYDGRYADELVRELLICKQQNINMTFVQAGKILPKDESKLQSSGVDFIKIDLNSPSEASALFVNATINLVIDLKTDIPGYIPFIPSKFVYLLYTDKPIIVFARKESWMHRLAEDNPEAGIFFADVLETGQLARQVQHILTLDKPKWKREKLRAYFSRENCIKEFLKRCQFLMDARKG